MNPDEYNNGFPGGFPEDDTGNFPGGFQGDFPGGGSYPGNIDPDFGRTSADPADIYRMKRELGYRTEEYDYARASRQKGIGIKLAVIGSIIMIIGVLGMCYIWLQSSGMEKIKSECAEANVTITLVQQHYSATHQKESVDQDTIYVSYDYDNKSYVNVIAGTVKTGLYQSGEKIPVLISKKNPGTVTLDQTDSIRSQTGIFMSVFSVGLIILIIHFLIKKTRKGMNQDI